MHINFISPENYSRLKGNKFSFMYLTGQIDDIHRYPVNSNEHGSKSKYIHITEYINTLCDFNMHAINQFQCWFRI